MNLLCFFLYVSQVHPDWNVFQYFLPAKLQNVFQSDATNRSRPMTYYIENPSGIANLFDNIAYAKCNSNSFFLSIHWVLNDFFLFLICSRMCSSNVLACAH